jgi:hypothetical protein
MVIGNQKHGVIAQKSTVWNVLPQNLIPYIRGANVFSKFSEPGVLSARREV